MTRKPARMYRAIKQQAYTRKEYMGGVPGLRIVQFDLGVTNGTFEYDVHLISKERCQIRHTALESARIASNRVLDKTCGPTGYHLRIRTYPHHILRENKQAMGAGADRISDGMRHSFGKPIGSAARVYEGDIILTVRVNEANLAAAKEACRRANMKLPTPTRVEVVRRPPAS